LRLSIGAAGMRGAPLRRGEVLAVPARDQHLAPRSLKYARNRGADAGAAAVTMTDLPLMLKGS